MKHGLNLNWRVRLPDRGKAEDHRIEKPRKINYFQTRMKGFFLWALVGVPMFTGCAFTGQNSLQPAISIPEHWNSALKKEPQQGVDPASKWWEALHDPVLSRLMNQAACENLDVRQAVSRVREVRFHLLQSRSSLFPAMDASASARKSGQGQGQARMSQGSEMYTAGFDAGWEVDIFGRVSQSVEASREDLAAQMENRHDVITTLLAEVAVNYIELRTLQERLAVAKKRITDQEEILELARALYKTGRDDELSVARAISSLESARTGIPDLNTAMEASMNRLAVLTGRHAGTLHGELSEVKTLPAFPVHLVIGIPAETIRRRPDIRQSERELSARVARTKQARAELYPKFTLNGSIGLESLSPEKLFSWSSRVWSFGPSFSWPLFDAGAIRNNIKAQSELQHQALIRYEGEILSAVEEVENALTGYAGEQQKLEMLISGADAAKTVAELALSRYSTGMTGFTEVLDARQSLFSFEDQLAQSKGAVLSNFVQLYKALGGGWQNFSEMPVSHSSLNSTGDPL
ncbi:MAG: TolC family protein [Proteobacteria bacterium]|nr:TolC family protein [Pseudomonadota bacterium]